MTTARSRGLGDPAETGLNRVGTRQAERAVEKHTGFGRGCAKRRDELDAFVPYEPAVEVEPG